MVHCLIDVALSRTKLLVSINNICINSQKPTLVHLVGMKEDTLPVFSNAAFSGNGSRLVGGQLFLMAPSDGVRRRLREELGAEGTCVGVRDWRGLRLKLSRWVLTSGLTGVWMT